MNELMYNFINQIEDVNKIREMSVEEFSKLVRSNKLISDSDAKKLIESFKKISSKKNTEDDGTEDSDQRKKKYRQEQKNINIKNISKMERQESEDKDKSEESLER